MITPEIEPILDDEEIEEAEVETSRTFKIDFETGRITDEMIEGIESIKQFIYLTLNTPRYEYAIFSDETGTELHDLIKDEVATIAYKEIEIPRLITEALIYDERIESVDNFDIEHIGNSFHVSFTVVTDEGAFDVEEVF